jgi:hypothetical protein
MARAARPGNGVICLTLNTRHSGLVRNPSCKAAVDLMARPRKLCLACVAVSDPTNGANEAIAEGESYFAIWQELEIDLSALSVDTAEVADWTGCHHRGREAALKPVLDGGKGNVQWDGLWRDVLWGELRVRSNRVGEAGRGATGWLIVQQDPATRPPQNAQFRREGQRGRCIRMQPAPVLILHLPQTFTVRIRIPHSPCASASHIHIGIGICAARDAHKALLSLLSPLTGDWAIHGSHHVSAGPSTDKPRQQANLASPPA